MTVDPFYKNMWQSNRYFESGQFSPHVTPTEKEIGGQIAICKLARANEPTNRADKSVSVN